MKVRALRHDGALTVEIPDEVAAEVDLRDGAEVEIVARGTEIVVAPATRTRPDRKSTRLNSSHANISYAVFCLKKKKKLISIDKSFDLLSSRFFHLTKGKDLSFSTGQCARDPSV